MSRVLVDSGIKWIGSLPDTWSITTVNKVFYRRKEVNDIENPTILSLSRDGVKIRDISTNEGQLAESYDNYHKVYKDDLMINPMDLISGANCSLSEVEGVISPAYINLAKKENNIFPKYYDYFFKYQYWINGMFIHGKGVSFDNRWTINWETMSSYKLPFPKYEEQKKIANYLDKQCKKIRKIIDDNKKECELLDELKKSYIDKFTSNVNWKKTTFKRYVRLNQGLQISQNLRFDEPGENRYEYITLATMNSDKKEYIENPPASVICVKDDILVARTGATGKIITNVEGVFHNNFFRVNYDNKINKNYLYYYLNKKKCQEYMLLVAGSTTIPDLNHSDFLSMELCVPTITDQEKIGKKLNELCSRLDKAIFYRKQIIEKLEEYKKSLIYECVTGKREV